MSYHEATSISSLSLQNILSQTESIIRNNQMASALLPLKCQLTTMQIFSEPFNAKYGARENVKPAISLLKKDQRNLKIDNFSVMKCKIEAHQINNKLKEQPQQNIKDNVKDKGFRGKLTRNLSSRKTEKRTLLSTSNTFRKVQQNTLKINFNNFVGKKNYSQTQNSSNIHQVSDLRRKNAIRTAAATSRTQKKYFEIDHKIINAHQQTIDNQNLKEEDTEKRLFFERIKKQKYQKTITDNLQHKLSIYRKSLQMQLQQAKIGETQPFKIKRSNQLNEIICYESKQNGNLLTNRPRKPLMKNMEKIIFLKYQQGKSDKFIKRQIRLEMSPCKRNNQMSLNQNIPQNQEQQDNANKFHTINYNYNNAGRRQVSVIPYLTINPGVRISEKSLQVTICRNQPPQNISRQEFIKSSHGFRSFSYKKNEMHSNQKQNFMTIDVNRGNHRVTKSTINNQTKDQFGESILWRPKTSRDSNKIKLINEQYARQMLVSIS